MSVIVRKRLMDSLKAEVRIEDLGYFRYPLGSERVEPRKVDDVLFAYIHCDKIQGSIGHICQNKLGPHKIRVCILKEDNPDFFIGIETIRERLLIRMA